LKLNSRFAVTTSRRPLSKQMDSARRIAGELKFPFIHRNELSLEDFLKKYFIDGIVVVSRQRISCIYKGQEFFFHPGMARLRIMELINGKTDPMIKAMSLQSGESVLDCTMGLGNDVIVASFVSGVKGKVTGLESSILISTLVRYGLSSFPETKKDLALAMRRVEVINTDYNEYLANLPPRSYDVIYFDPMFRNPVNHSPAINAVRFLANPEPVDRHAVELASRAAVKKVIMKERRGSTEFERLGFRTVMGGKYAPVVYGVIDLQGSM